MRLTIDIVITDDAYEVFVFPRPGSPEDQFRVAWACWERDDLPREIGTAVLAAIDAHAHEAVEELRAFLRAGVEQLADERRRLDERARRQEWAT